MTSHTLAASTRTLELEQILQINGELRRLRDADADPMLTAEFLGVAGATVHPRVLDRAAAQLVPLQNRHRELPDPLDAAAPLRRLLPTGSPSAPYLYGVFADRHGRGELPVSVHTAQLKLISETLGLRRHLWGV